MRAQYKNRLIFLVLTLALLVPTLTLLIPSSSASAAAYSKLNAADKARSYTYYRAMAVECMSGIRNEIKADANYDGLKTDPANGYWYGEGDSSNPDRKGGWSGDAKNEGDVTPKNSTASGTIGCTEITKTALANYWGGATPAELLKALKYEWNGTDKWVFKGDGSKKSQYLKDFLSYKGVSMEYTPAVEYFVNHNAFINSNFCAAKDNGVYGEFSDSIKNRYGTYNTGYNPYEDNVYKKVTISGQAGPEEHGFTYKLTDLKRADSAYLLYTDNYKTCDEMAANITKTASAYFDAVATDTCKAAKGYEGSLLAACKDGMKNSATERAPIYCNKYTDAPQKAACEVGIGLQAEVISASANNTDDSGADGEGRSSSCVVEGIGWIVCPITNFLALIADSSFDVISGFLEVNVSLYDSNSGTKVAWDAFRNIANVAFVVAFLVIIFSQLTGQGVSNYGVKKTLHRIIVAAILVNISFYICQIAVDVTQILGGSIRDVLSAIPVGDPTNTVVPEWSTVMGDVLMGSGILVGALAATAALSAIVALSISLPVLLAALLAILMTVIILIGRQAAIVILITLAPLAFVAFLLPNTEAWFKRWYKMFFALLMVFPIIALLYGGGELAAKIIANTANSPGVEASAKFWLSITAMGVAAIPLIMTPTLLKGALNGLGSIGGKISGFASKANANIRKTANTSSRYGEAKQGLKNRFALSRATRRANSNIQKGIDQSRVGRALGFDKGSSRAVSVVKEEFEKQVKDASSSQSEYSLDMLKGIATTGTYNGKRVSEAAHAAAVDKVMAVGGFNDRKAVLESMASNKGSTSTELRSRAVSAAYAKGDANIYGTSFGDKIVQSNGSINSAADLTSQTVKNAADGSLSAENLVQGESSARYIVDSVLNSGDDKAKRNIQSAAVTAKTNPGTIPKVTPAIDTEFIKLGVTAAPQPAPQNGGLQIARTARDVHDAARAAAQPANAGELQIPRTPTTPPAGPPAGGGQPTP